MSRFAIGLGSNEGDRLEHLRAAVAGLESLGSIDEVSPLYETEPVGGPDQGPFLNAVVVLDTDLEPGRLLTGLQEIEAAAGRKRTVRWGPRTLDLDILASDGPPISTGSLSIPHPRAAEREFVLRPLAAVWPQADVGGLPASDALAALDDQGVDELRRHWVDDRDRWVAWTLVSIQMAWFIGIGVSFAADGSLPGRSAGFVHVVGGLMAFAGAVLAFTASRRLGSRISPFPEPMEGIDLVETGPYALARHPMYGGVLLFVTGSALFLESLLGLALSVALGVFFYVKSGYEEKRLRVRYPSYRAYSRRVTARLIPFLV